jgi:hypothetical protein
LNTNFFLPVTASHPHRAARWYYLFSSYLCLFFLWYPIFKKNALPFIIFFLMVAYLARFAVRGSKNNFESILSPFYLFLRGV